jgi:hypothetical protein
MIGLAHVFSEPLNWEHLLTSGASLHTRWQVDLGALSGKRYAYGDSIDTYLAGKRSSGARLSASRVFSRPILPFIGQQLEELIIGQDALPPIAAGTRRNNVGKIIGSSASQWDAVFPL